MATRINIMKLLQETRGFAEITNRQPQGRPLGPILLQSRSVGFRNGALKRKRNIRINMQDPPDIPHPVKITHLPKKAASAA